MRRPLRGAAAGRRVAAPSLPPSLSLLLLCVSLPLAPGSKQVAPSTRRRGGFGGGGGDYSGLGAGRGQPLDEAPAPRRAADRFRRPQSPRPPSRASTSSTVDT